MGDDLKLMIDLLCELLASVRNLLVLGSYLGLMLLDDLGFPFLDLLKLGVLLGLG